MVSNTTTATGDTQTSGVSNVGYVQTTGTFTAPAPPIATLPYIVPPAQSTQAPAPSAAGDGDEEGTPVDWETAYASLSPTAKAAYDQHVAGLRSALEKERNKGKELGKRLGQIQEGAEAEREQKLKALQTELKEANRRLAFIGAPEAMTLADQDAAYLVAAAKNLFDESGVPKWDDLKKAHPALFKQAAQPPATPPPPPPNINGGSRGDGTGARVVTFNGKSLEDVANRYNVKLPRTNGRA